MKPYHEREDVVLYPYNWELSSTIFKKNNGTVFSCFACGGGSTMGYKLAGFDVIGCNDIDKKMMEIYIANHDPEIQYLYDIRDMLHRNDIPDIMYNLDILDGSPPCTSFSMSGNREKDWGKKKKFREGQATQTLDDLSFHFILLANKLKPKIIVLENVSGILKGNAKKISSMIYEMLYQNGYCTKHFILNAKNMGVPQSRERVFFIGVRNDLVDILDDNIIRQEPIIDMKFKFPIIPYSAIRQNNGEKSAYSLSDKFIDYWNNTPDGKSFSVAHPNGSCFNEVKTSIDNPIPTLRASGVAYDCIEPRKLFVKEQILASSFPLDFNFCGSSPNYVMGMSVPPVMMAHIANEIYNQLLKPLNTKLDQTDIFRSTE